MVSKISKNGMGRFVKVLSVAESLNERVGQVVSYLLYFLVAVILYEVAARYIFNSPTIWAFEMSSFTFAVVILLGGGYTLLHKGHINIDILTNRLPPRGRAILDLITAPFFFIFVIVLLWEGIDVFLSSLSSFEHTWSAWHPPLYPIKLALPVGAALILLQGLVKFIKDIIIATGRQI